MASTSSLKEFNQNVASGGSPMAAADDVGDTGVASWNSSESTTSALGTRSRARSRCRGGLRRPEGAFITRAVTSDRHGGPLDAVVSRTARCGRRTAGRREYSTQPGAPSRAVQSPRARCLPHPQRAGSQANGAPSPLAASGKSRGRVHCRRLLEHRQTGHSLRITRSDSHRAPQLRRFAHTNQARDGGLSEDDEDDRILPATRGCRDVRLRRRRRATAPRRAPGPEFRSCGREIIGQVEGGRASGRVIYCAPRP